MTITLKLGHKAQCFVVAIFKRHYHDESFGFRKPRAFSVPDYTPAQLQNRAENASLQRYVDGMRTHGHRAALIDPLNMLEREEVPALDPYRYGLEPGGMYPINGIVWNASDDKWALERIVQHMRRTYVGRIAYEFMHSISKTERLWFSHLLEGDTDTTLHFQPEEKKRIWSLLARSEIFDHFMQVKFPNVKRYGLEGGESMLPALDALFDEASKAGIEHINLAMPHRGRLNLLTDLLKYSPSALFHKIKGGSEFPSDIQIAGDVISHIVASPTLEYTSPLEITLLPNPSHLEAINPVALGKTRAQQFELIRDADPECMLGDKVMCVQLHGDASFTGQGVVMETLGLSNLPHFTSGGSIHIVVNNNIGYTTPATSARSSLYCSDIGKMINAPILHVNGDYPEDVVRAVKTAFKYRNHFRKDIIIDLLVYRRWGHNELDEPGFTQPEMYKKIRSRRSVPEIYQDKLIEESVISIDGCTEERDAYRTHLDKHLNAMSTYVVPTIPQVHSPWKHMVLPMSRDALRYPITGIDKEQLRKLGEASVRVPEEFSIHPRLKRHIKHRLESLQRGSGIDWGTAEAIAMGSLLSQGHNIRISGQDVGRGTFSHRHAMLVDQQTERVTVPLNNNLICDGKLELANSSLSEMAVLGFEYGMSWESPNLLPIWEAQFGDFFNGAQVIIDTFISSAETKWLKQSGLIMLLPHGLDGAGPEHSSMRIERFLQLTNDPYEETDESNINMHVVNPTTPAQYFHLLRRQMMRNYRRPLIVASPKVLLRSPVATSTLEDVGPGTKFSPIIVDDVRDASNVLLCSGKIYYDLMRERSSRALDSEYAIIRLEELAPFPFTLLRTALEGMKNVTRIRWVQEEPRNQGAWPHVEPRLRYLLSERKEITLEYWGRSEDTVPAVGISKVYKEQQERVLKGAFV